MELRTTPLPFEPTSDISRDSEVLKAYNTAIRFERHSGSEDHKLFARVLGYLLRELPKEKGRKTLASRILRCNEDLDELAVAGDDYMNNFIGIFKQMKTYPASSPSASRAQTHVKELSKSEAQEATPNGRARFDALRRDGYCCVITGAMDEAYHLSDRTRIPPKGTTDVTEVAHIFPQCLARNIEHSESMSHSHTNILQREYYSQVFSILRMFGYESLSSELSGMGIHRLENLLTLTKGCHSSFDHLNLWLEPCDENKPSTYRVCTPSQYRKSGIPDEVTFTSTNAELARPSRDYLAIHACCARVAHLSGAAEHIDKIQRDREELCVLSKDGSSAKLLEELLRHVFPTTPHVHCDRRMRDDERRIPGGCLF